MAKNLIFKKCPVARIKLAKTHRSREIRKKAIFWLGQSDDPRAVETLVEIARK